MSQNLTPYKKRKRIFNGTRRQDVIPEVIPEDIPESSVSQQPAHQPPPNKIAVNLGDYDVLLDCPEAEAEDCPKDNGVRDLMDMEYYAKTVLCILGCIVCKEAGALRCEAVSRSGLATRFKQYCTNCIALGRKDKYEVFFYNSDPRSYECEGKSITASPINVQLVVAGRTAGFGFAGSTKFLTFMGLNSLSKTLFYKCQNIASDCIQKVADKSMARARDEAIAQAIESTGSSDLSASFDGSWMRRGFHSLAGFISCISIFTNKIIGVEARHKYCASCRAKGNCKLGNKCAINHIGSSGSMEPAAAVILIKRLYSLGAKITRYLGDGDSSAYKTVLAACPWVTQKLECLAHVAKGFGKAHRKRVKDVKDNLYLGKRKGIGGIGRLTDKAIHKLQTYYHLYVRHYRTPKRIAQATMAMYDHVTSTDKKPNHKNCDIKFCGYLKDPKNYKHKNKRNFHLPIEIMAPVKSVFEKKAEISFLEKVSHGKTTNANECFNSTVWNLISKNGFANLQLVNMALNIAVCQYNDGQLPILHILQDLGVSVSKGMAVRCKSMDQQRLYKITKSKAQSAKRAKRRLGVKNAEKDAGEPAYSPGAYSE